MSQAAAQQPSRKKAVISLLVLLALTCIIVFTFKDHWAEITAALAQLSVWQVLAVLAVGISYPLLEGCVALVIVRSRLPQFKLWQGLDVGWCGTFGNVVTLGAGAVPVQTWYLHRCGLPKERLAIPAQPAAPGRERPLDRKGILAVTMPCFGTTARTKGNAEKLAEAYGVTLKTVDIKAAVDQHFEDIGQSKDDLSVTFENGQARMRTLVLMNLANKTGGMVAVSYTHLRAHET